MDAEELWRRLAADSAPADAAACLAAIAGAYELALADLEVPAPAPTDRFVVAGPSAIAALLGRFASGADLGNGTDR